MILGVHSSQIRCLLVWAAATTALAVLVQVSAGPTISAWRQVSSPTPTGVGLDVALVGLAGLVLIGCTGWLWLVATAVTLEAARGIPDPECHRRGVPIVVRRVLLAACGVALTGVAVPPSFGTPPHIHHAHHRMHRAALDGLPLPDRAVTPPRPSAPSASASPSPSPGRTVLVAHGDTLWSIAARGLPSSATNAAIAARWHAVYAANRSLIGPDPDVIVPGQRLRLPGKDQT